MTKDSRQEIKYPENKKCAPKNAPMPKMSRIGPDRT